MVFIFGWSVLALIALLLLVSVIRMEAFCRVWMDDGVAAMTARHEPVGIAPLARTVARLQRWVWILAGEVFILAFAFLCLAFEVIRP